MAYRDRSQGFGFVYLDLASLIANKDELERKHFPSEYQKESKTINFNRDPIVRANEEKMPAPAPQISQIRENLDRLQALHHKLHAMLEELNNMSPKKNNGSDDEGKN